MQQRMRCAYIWDSVAEEAPASVVVNAGFGWRKHGLDCDDFDYVLETLSTHQIVEDNICDFETYSDDASRCPRTGARNVQHETA